MNVALVEPVMTGHRPTYLKYYIEAFLKKGHHVYVFCPEDSAEQFRMYPENGVELTFIDYRIEKKKYSRFSTPRNVWRQWKIYSEKVNERSISIDLTFFMSLDTFHLFFFKKLEFLGIPIHHYLNNAVPYLVDRIHKSKWAGIFLTPNTDYDHMFLSKKNIAIGILEETVRFQNEELNQRIISIPDITNTELFDEKSELEKDVLEKAAGRRIISLPGRIHKRKSVITLLDAAHELKNENYYFVIAGEPALDSFSEGEKSRLNKREEDNYLIYPERIEDGHEFNSLIRCSTMIFASYINFPHSSNILTKCAHFQKPMIVSEGKYMASMAQKYNMGVSIRERSVTEAVEAIREIANSFDISEARFQAYYNRHKVDHIDDVVDDIIQLYEEV